MLRCEFVGLPAREEDDAGYCSRYVMPQTADRRRGDLFDARLLRRVVTREHHVRLQQHPFELDALIAELGEDGMLHARSDVVRLVDRVRAVHQHLGLDDRDEPRFLRERRVAGEGVCVRPDRVLARPSLADRVDAAPLGEAGSESAIFLEALAQLVEALGDRLARCERELLRTLVDLDSRDDSLRLEELRERRPVGGGLPDRLVEEDDSADPLLDSVSREQQLAVGAPGLLGRFDADRVEPLLDRAGALVGRQDPLPVRDERTCGLGEHDRIIPRRAWVPPGRASAARRWVEPRRSASIGQVATAPFA